MKKIIYSFVVLLAFCLSSCEEVDNLSNNGNSGPLVTIYSYAAPAGMDADLTANLRFIPNPACSEFYFLIEKKTEKDAFISANGEKAYVERVLEYGLKYPAKNLDYIKEELGSTYAITAVGVNTKGNPGNPQEVIFYGVDWQPVGVGSYTSQIFGETFPVQFSRPADGDNRYKMIGFFGNDIIINVNPALGKAVILAQSLGEDLFGEDKESWIECTAGTYVNGVCTFAGDTWDNAIYTSEAMINGIRMEGEVFTLPEGSY